MSEERIKELYPSKVIKAELRQAYEYDEIVELYNYLDNNIDSEYAHLLICYDLSKEELAIIIKEMLC
jgi:hypothetical protein